MTLPISVLAFLIGLAYILYIRSKDVYEKEPLDTLFFTFVVGGLASVFLALGFYSFIPVGEHTLLSAFFRVGPVEEAAKFLALLITYKVFRKQFNEPADGLVYMSTVALGFATLENIMYALNANGSYLLLFYRSAVCVIAHIAFSSFMGIAFFIHQKVHKNYLGLFSAFVFASASHGLYDGVLFQPELGFLWKFVFVGIILVLLGLIHMMLSVSPFRKSLMHDDVFIESDRKAFIKCNHCHTSIEGKEVTFENITLAICHQCDFVSMEQFQAIKLLKYYSPHYSSRRAKGVFKGEKITLYFTDDQQVIYHTQRGTLSGHVVSLHHWLEEQNREEQNRVLRHPIFGPILKLIGARYLVNR